MEDKSSFVCGMSRVPEPEPKPVKENCICLT